MTGKTKYSLQEMTNISFSGFFLEISNETIQQINSLCSKLGSTGIIPINRVFKKKNRSVPIALLTSTHTSSNIPLHKKRRGRESIETEEWSALRTFKTTKITSKSGVELELDNIRLLFNKLSEKTFVDVREKTLDKLGNILQEYSDEEDISKMGEAIYDLLSSNKMISKTNADLYAEILSMYPAFRQIFDTKLATIIEQYMDILYIDANVDYDGFCNMNKVNEKRKAVTLFLVNLAKNGFIEKQEIIKLLQILLQRLLNMIVEPDKRNEVDELTENIAILCVKEFIHTVKDNTEYYIDGEPIYTVVKRLAKSKSKDYLSLSNKAIFKFMDLADV